MKKTLRATTQCVAALFVSTVVGLVVGGCKDSKRYYNSSTATSTGTPTLVAKVGSLEVGSTHEVGKQTTTQFALFEREANGNLRQLTANEVNSSQNPNQSSVGTFGGNLSFLANNVNGDVVVTLTLVSNTSVTKTFTIRVVDSPNNTTTGTAGLVVKDGSTEVGSTHEVGKQTTTQFTLYERDANGNLRQLTPSEVNSSQGPNPSSAGTFGGNFSFLANNSNGDVVVTLTLVSNTSVTKTFTIRVVDSPNNTGGGSTSAAVTGIQLTPESQAAIAAHQPRKINAAVNTGSGLTAASMETLFVRVSEAQLQARQCVVDANGVFRGALAGASFNVEAFGVGGQVSGGQTTERARVLVGSNVVIVNTDNTQLNGAGLIFFAPAFMMAGMDYRPVAKNGATEITYDAGTNLTSSDPNVVTVTTDGAGKKVLRALRDGIVTIMMTSTAYPGVTYEHRLRVTNSNPFRQPFNSQFIVNTHMNMDIMPDPTDTNTTNPTRWVVVRVFNLSKCATVTDIAAANHPSPLDFPSVGNLQGQQAPLFDIIYIDAEGIKRGVSRKTYTNPSGNVILDAINFAGTSQSPIDESKYGDSGVWSFARDLSEDHFYDQYGVNDRNLSVQMQVPAGLNAANAHQTAFVRHDRS